MSFGRERFVDSRPSLSLSLSLDRPTIITQKKNDLLLLLTSLSLQIFVITLTASTGNAPAAVSPESITQSVPSSTALATSVASARVGRGFLHIDSSICVAVMTGLPAMLHLRGEEGKEERERE